MINISEAKSQLSAVIEQLQKDGYEVIIGKAGKPVAKIVRYDRMDKHKRIGALKGKIEVSDDFDSLPEDVAKSLGMQD